MKKMDISLDWTFEESTPRDFMERAEPQSVDLPHDFIYPKPRKPDAAGGAGNGYFDQGHGIYNKLLHIPEEMRNKRVILDIDGAYMNAEIYLDKDLLALHPYGYSPFLVDLSDYISAPEHKLRIATHSPQPSSRWYAGGGLYRKVSLWTGESICVQPWDIFVTTPTAGPEQAVAQASFTIHNYTDTDTYANVAATVCDATGQPCAAAETTLRVSARSAADGSCLLPWLRPQLWSVDTPSLYTLNLWISANGDITDSAEVQFGVRKLEVDVESGLRINGQPIKLKGGCIHHDNGFLGAAAFPRAEERKIEILKAAGYNAVRISHYPPSLAMLEACDRLGMLLLDEAFDSWRHGKPALDYHLYFEDWWERDITYMVLRDRNHPCVLTYSIGNEIGERDGRSNGARWAHKLAEKIRALDNTRFVTSAICGIFDLNEDLIGDTNFDANQIGASTGRDYWGERTAEYAAALDIVGYNYLYGRYADDHKKFPKRIICGTESMAFNTYDYWQAVLANPHVIGDFIWTAYDNLGESGVGRVCWPEDKYHGFQGQYPWKTSFQSDHDLCGYRKPQSFYRKLMWGDTDEPAMFTTHPCHTGQEFHSKGWHWYDVEPTWTYAPEWLGKPVKVDVYANGDEAEFILNGRSLGRAPINRLIASLEIPYEPGKLEAVIYKSQVECTRACLQTTGEPSRLTLSPDRSLIRADRQDLSYIAVTILDADGKRVIAAEHMLHCSVEAPGMFAGIGNGDPKSEDVLAAPYCHAFEGRAMIAVRAMTEGEFTVRITSDGLPDAVCTLRAEV